MSRFYLILFLWLSISRFYADQRPLDNKQGTVLLNTTDNGNKDTRNEDVSRYCGIPSHVSPYNQTENQNIWKTSQITYRIHNWTRPFTKSQLKDVFENVIRMWTYQVNLVVTESETENADINIYFTDQDGINKILGYAYFPEAGDIYFDLNEEWTLNPSLATGNKTYFLWVAIHEFGHALGLPHSKKMSSIMYKLYSDIVLRPSKKDIKNLKKLYGPRGANNTILCKKSSVDALLKINTTEHLLIKGLEYWRLSNNSLKSGPFHIESLFSIYPDSIDAALSIGKKIYFFQNHSTHIYDLEKETYNLKNISVAFEGIPPNLDASFFDPTTGIIYFFKGERYYASDINRAKGRLVKDQNISNGWKGVPDHVEAASYLKNSQVLFIKSGRCYIANVHTKQVQNSEECNLFLYKC